MSEVSRRRPLVLVSSVSSDSHTWNLAFLQLLLEENGHEVVNLGACVPDELLLSECAARRPDAVVISTVNGHGHVDGRRLIGRVRADERLRDLPVVIGGKLGVGGEDDTALATGLVEHGFNAVFADDTDPAGFVRYLESVTPLRPARDAG